MRRRSGLAAIVVLVAIAGCSESDNASRPGAEGGSGGGAGVAGSAGGSASGGQSGTGGSSGSGGVGGAETTRKVLVLIFQPKNPQSGELIWQDYNWNDPKLLADQAALWWPTASKGKLAYQIVETIVREDFPAKTDGFVYDYAGWEAVMQDPSSSHMPDLSDYPKIISEIGLCEKVNAGAVDELWMFGAPYMGFGESGLAGPGIFPYNGPGYSNNSCNRLVPIMGFNYERTRSEMLHNWGHRAEATMSKVFGGWEQNRMSHAWDIFALTAVQSPDFGFSGCGSIHYPPNALGDYDYAESAAQSSYCRAFANYPNLPADLKTALEPLDCTAWGCSQDGFLEFWFGHIPRADGVIDGIANDWWTYIIDPNSARSCNYFGTEAECQAVPHCQWACGGCLKHTVSTVDACSDCGKVRTLEQCNAAGCAWYSCAEGLLSCWPQGTPPSQACAG